MKRTNRGPSTQLLGLALGLSFAALTACSTSPPSVRVVSFGDSLSDLGTYADRTEGKTAGRFTTNPGPLWVEIVASQLGTSISSYRRAGWGHPERVLGGFGYAEGGSRVAEQPGSNNTDDTKGVGSSQTTLPIRDQVSLHLLRDGFRRSDAVLIWGGANDVFRQALFAPAPTPEAAAVAVRVAARALTVEARRIIERGGPRTVVLTIDNYGEVPAFRNTPNSEKLSRLSDAFNDELRTQLEGSGARLVEVGQLLSDARGDPARFGLKNGVARACAVPSLPLRDVLFCTDHTLVEAGADKSYLYADGVHLTSAGHMLVAEAVLRSLNR